MALALRRKAGACKYGDRGSFLMSNKYRKIKLLDRRSSGVEPTAMSGHSKRTFVMRRFAREVTRVAGKYTKRQRWEDRLQESEEFSSSLLDNSPNPIIVINPDTSVKYVNPALEKLTGFASAEIMGRKAPYPWWTEETLQKTNKDFEKAIREGAQRLEELFQTKNGDRFWVEITSRPVKKDGKLKYYLANWIDITERKRAEEALRESEERYKDIVENAGVAICADDENGNLTYFNKEFADLFGYSIEEMKKQSHKTLLHLDDLQIVSEFHKRHMQGEKEPSRYEFGGLKKDGSVIHLEVVIGSILTEDGSVIGIRNYFWDITERKRAEEALERSEKRYRNLFNDAKDGLIHLDESGIILDVNQAAVQMFGGSKKELLGRHFTQVGIFSSSDVPVLMENFAKILAGKLPVVTVAIKNKNGQEITLECTVSLVITEDAKTSMMVIARDITERKRAEEALRKTTNYLESLIDYANAPIIVWDPGSRITRFNQAFGHLTGYTADEIIGQQLRILFPEASRDESLREIARAVSGEYWVSVEIPILCKDGDVQLVLWNSANIYSEDGTTLLATIAQGTDITERKQAEEALRKTTEDLKAEREEMSEMNLVFKHIFEHLEEERQEYKHHICQDIEQVVMPILERLKEKVGSTHGRELEALEVNLKDVLAKDVDVFRERYAKLTPRELEICEMIKEGLSSKEISDNLNLSLLTVHKHREDIRKKLGITNKAVNLGSYLRTR